MHYTESLIVEVIKRLHDASTAQTRNKYTNRQWPIDGGRNLIPDADQHDCDNLLVTG